MKRTNYCMVYLTKEEEGYTLWNNEPHRRERYRSGEWVDSHDRKPMTGDTMPLVDAQVYGGNYIEKKDDKATPAIIVPIDLMADFSEPTGTPMDNDMVSFSVDDNTIKIVTEMSGKIDKSSAKLFATVNKLTEAADQIPHIITRASKLTDKHNAMFLLLEEKVREIAALIDDSDGKKKKKKIKHADVVEDVIETEPSINKKAGAYAQSHLKDLTTGVLALLNEFREASNREMSKFNPVADMIQDAVNAIKPIAKEVDTTSRDLRTKLQQRPAGEAVKRLYQRIDILNDSINTVTGRVATLKTECSALENQNVLLIAEAVNLRKGMAEWMKEQMPDAYKKLLSFSYNIENIRSANSMGEKMSKELLHSIKRAGEAIGEFDKHWKIEKKEIKECQDQAFALDVNLKKILARISAEERESVKESVTDTESVEAAIKEAEAATAERRAGKAKDQDSKRRKSQTDKTHDTDDKKRQEAQEKAEAHVKALNPSNENTEKDTDNVPSEKAE